jgi:hypothetical protein
VDAGRRARPAQRDDMPNFGQREPKPAGLPHERQERQHVGRIATIAGGCPAGRRKDAAGLVEPKRLAAHPASRGHLSDQQPVFHEGSIGLAPWGNVKPPREASDLPE